MRMIKIIWLVIGVSFLVSFALPVGKYGDGYIFGYSYFFWAFCGLFYPPVWYYSASFLSNIWFVWAWASVWEHLDDPDRRHNWRDIIVIGSIANVFAFFPVVFFAVELGLSVVTGMRVGIGMYVWFGSLLGMLLLTLKFAISRRRI